MTQVEIRWEKLRPYDGSLQRGFEELCCMLARRAGIELQGVQFERHEAPDGGAECTWQLGNGDLIGWQAKWLTAIGQSQWRQIDKSVRDALRNYPHLVRFNVCVPLNLNSGLGRRKSQRQTWNEYVKKWKRAANRPIEFNYVGRSDLNNDLLVESNWPLIRYWFNDHLLDQRWFKQQVEGSIANAGTRFQPALHVDVAATRRIEAIGMTEEFCTSFAERIHRLGVASQKANSSIRPALPAPELEQFLASMEFCRQTATNLKSDHEELPKEALEFQLGQMAHFVRTAQNHWSSRRADDAAPTNHSHLALDHQVATMTLHQLEEAIHAVEYELTSGASSVSSSTGMVMTGEAGMGKTHTLCHAAQHRIARAQPTILLLSGSLAKDELWSQVLRNLQLPNMRTDDFLGLLSVASELSGCRALILIDALNEGEARDTWKQTFASFVSKLGQYPRVRLVVTVRTSFLRFTLPDQQEVGNCRFIEHKGFYGREVAATSRYFAHFELTAHSIPILDPEFSNPLFLLIFCRGLRHQRSKEIESGSGGITRVFSNYIEALEFEASTHLDLDPRARTVRRVTDVLIEKMMEGEHAELPRSIASQISRAVHPVENHSKSLFKWLLDSGLLLEDTRRQADGEVAEVVRFAYERYADHLMARRILDQCMESESVERIFNPLMLRQLLGKPDQYLNRQGLLEALAIQVPELLEGQELADVLPEEEQSDWAVFRAMRQSILWRSSKSFSKRTEAFLLEQLYEGDEEESAECLSSLVKVSARTEHPWNAKFLHKHILLPQSLPARDQHWSIWCHYEYMQDDSNSGPICRLLKACEDTSIRTTLSAESAALSATALAWFGSNANRFLRDHATAVTAEVLCTHLGVIPDLLRSFQGVNDPYVLDRLLCAVYGALMRTGDSAIAQTVADVCLELWGEPNRLPTHLLARDHLAGIAERAAFLNGRPLADSRLPFTFGASEWPSDLPSMDELKNLWNQSELAGSRIPGSVTVGDFGIYILGGNGRNIPWTRVPRGKRAPTFRQLHQAFERELDKAQRNAVKACIADWRKQKSVMARAQNLEDLLSDDAHRTTRALAEQRKRSLAHAESILSSEQKLELWDLLEYFESAQHNLLSKLKIRPQLLQRFILARVIALGWKSERFGPFDNYIPDVNRDTKKAERYGKKYQWIAYWEALARLADSFQFAGRGSYAVVGDYVGAWQVSRGRETDPSAGLQLDPKVSDSHPLPWWQPPMAQGWQEGTKDLEWLQDRSNLPPISKAWRLQDPHGRRWLNLSCHFHWYEPMPLGYEKFTMPRRGVWSYLQAFIVKRKNASAFRQWLCSQDFFGRWMPEGWSIRDVHLGEQYWSTAFNSLCSGLSGDEAWVVGDSSPKSPIRMLVPSMEYAGSGSDYDCSPSSDLRVSIPAPWLFNAMQLESRGEVGRYYSRKTGTCVAFDPAPRRLSLESPGPSALMVSEEDLLQAVHNESCEIVWTALSTKHISGGGLPPRAEMRISEVFWLEEGIEKSHALDWSVEFLP